jgi:hypothetical protein
VQTNRRPLPRALNSDAGSMTAEEAIPVQSRVVDGECKAARRYGDRRYTTVNDAFGTAARSLARSLTVAPRGAWREVGRSGETVPLAEQRNAGEARLISGPNLVQNVWNVVALRTAPMA